MPRDGKYHLPKNRQSGSTLIEVLIAMFVIAVGLLGVAGMMTYTTKGNHSAYLRSQASFLAYDLADAMRASPADFLDGGFDNDCTSCAYRQTWNGRVISELGDTARGSVIRTGNEVTISLTWNDSRGELLDGQGNEATGIDAANNVFEFKTEI
ncbi:type IV pilus modification protein PilV [Marinobacterium lutimaris]|uniref:Type IV pilus assembly protein PilV n=1 Tax=Marinobacterium lutimaris TaxID=568106 RepID=A0A1H6CVR1_9GAMM|nr:type IV pilus modification protein PilV [Marinobacterium lutimaris]SEG76887.1 type IV pilus assembly protein PilV [Marinobacterium lutimaris]